MRNEFKKDLSPILGLLGRFGLILIFPILMYFWGTAIIYNLANFWNVFTPTPIEQLSQLGTVATAPVLTSLPPAVKEGQISVSGFAQEGNEVSLFVNGENVAKVRAGKDGQFSFEKVKLNEGENEIYAKSINNLKEESLPSEKSTVKYLNKPPFLEITNLPERTDIHQKDNHFTIIGLTDSQAAITINGSQAFVDANGHFSFGFSLNDGENKITIEALDPAGNQTTLERIINYFKD